MTSPTILPYRPDFKPQFKSLNIEWIEKYFKVEAADLKALDDPDKIIADGGAIHFADIGGVLVGVCTLVKLPSEHDYDYELAKMGITPGHQGKGLGRLLATSIVEKARQQGAKTLFLESNRRLTPALTLYASLGFEELPFSPSVYDRSDIQMLLYL